MSDKELKSKKNEFSSDFPIVPEALRNPISWVRRILAGLGITTTVLIFVPIFIAILWLRYLGLPSQVKYYVQKELEKQGLQVEFERLLLDPSGGLIADRLTVYRGGEKEQVWVQVDRVRIGIAWLSWWRGEPFIQSASIRNATIQLPVSPRESMGLDETYADIVFKKGLIEVLDGRSRILNFQLQVKGVIELNGRAPARPATESDLVYRENLWRAFRTYAMEFEGEKPILVTLEFRTPTLHPEQAQASLFIQSKHCRWRGVQVEEIGLQAHLEEGRLRLEDIHLQLARGEWLAKGDWNLDEKRAAIEFQSTLDISSFATAFPGKVGEALGKLSFEDPARCSGRLTTAFNPDFQYNLQLDLNWSKFSYGNVSFDRLTFPIAMDSSRLLVSGMNLVSSKGEVSFSAFYDRSIPEVKGHLKSSLDPTVFIGVFGEAADRFLSSLQFQEKGPSLDIKLNGGSIEPRDWKISGKVAVEKGFYKKVYIESASSDLGFEKGQLVLSNLKAKRPEGEAHGRVVYDFAQQTVFLDQVVSTIMVRDIAIMFGSVFDSYLKPYVLSVAPLVHAHGLIDIMAAREEPLHDLKLQIQSQGVLDYQFMGKPLKFNKPKIDLTIQKRILQLTSKSAELFDGKFGLVFTMDMKHADPEFQTSITYSESSFQQFMKIFYNYDNAKGSMSGRLGLSGTLGKTETFKGDGQISIRDGYILSIPFMGGLSDLLGVMIPNFGYAKADRAGMNFLLNNGKLTTEDLEVSSTAFSLIGNGGYDFAKDDLDLNTRVNIKGVVGLLLFPVSKLFEYHGSGSMKEPKWSPKILE